MRLFVAALVAAGAALGACDARPGTVATAPSPTPVTGVGCPVPARGTAEPTASLVPGPSNGLSPTTARGEPLVVEAVILDRACRPAAGAHARIWHTDSRGLYGPPGTRDCCYYAGTVRTDGAGRFRLETIRPAQYPVPDAPPAHIHLEIRHADTTLDTEITFTDQPAPSIAPRTGPILPIQLVRTGDAWRGEALFVIG